MIKNKEAGYYQSLVKASDQPKSDFYKSPNTDDKTKKKSKKKKNSK